LECVVGAQSDSYVCLLEKVRNKGGLSAEVHEGGPFMCGRFGEETNTLPLWE